MKRRVAPASFVFNPRHIRFLSVYSECDTSVDACARTDDPKFALRLLKQHRSLYKALQLPEMSGAMQPITSFWQSARALRRPGYCSRAALQARRQPSYTRCHASSLSGASRDVAKKAEMPNELMRIIVNHIKVRSTEGFGGDCMKNSKSSFLLVEDPWSNAATSIYWPLPWTSDAGLLH